MKYLLFLKHIILGFFSMVWLFPIAAILITISKSGRQYMDLGYWQLPALSDIPTNLWANFSFAIVNTEIISGFLNSLLYAGIAALGAALIASFAGYAIVHLDVKRPLLWFGLIFSGNLLPFQMYLLPLYLSYTSIGIYDTRLGFALVHLGLCIPFALFLYRNYAFKVLSSLIDAAKCDGCTDFEVYLHVFLPITKPAFLSVFIVQFIWSWNDLLFGILLTENVRPIMAEVARLSPARAYTPVPVILAGSLLAAIPTIVLFLFLNQYFVEGLKIRADK